MPDSQESTKHDTASAGVSGKQIYTQIQIAPRKRELPNSIDNKKVDFLGGMFVLHKPDIFGIQYFETTIYCSMSSIALLDWIGRVVAVVSSRGIPHLQWISPVCSSSQSAQ